MAPLAGDETLYYIAVVQHGIKFAQFVYITLPEELRERKSPGSAKFRVCTYLHHSAINFS
jgi:hypothetical protein